jgi:hypothetical protein
MNVFIRYKNATESTTDQAVIEKDVNDLVEYEFRLASQFLEDEYTRMPAYERVRIQDLAKGSTAISVFKYIQKLVEYSKVGENINSSLITRNVVVESPEYLKRINAELLAAVTDDKLRVVYNYM